MKQIVICAPFDNARSADFRFAEEASRFGPLRVLLWSDEAVRAATGRDPKFPLAEREYLVRAMRYVEEVSITGSVPPDALPTSGRKSPAVWVVRESEDSAAKRAYCAAQRIDYRVIPEQTLTVFPEAEGSRATSRNHGRKKVLVTGCYDWFHSGHVAFFEEVSAFGDLFVVVGHDANIRLLKGAGHPMYSQNERRYVVGSIRFVHQALVSTGTGWMDAEPEILRIQPDIYAVNDDGDRPEKREFCERHRIEYRVLKRLPKPGLPRRESTQLRRSLLAL